MTWEPVWENEFQKVSRARVVGGWIYCMESWKRDEDDHLVYLGASIAFVPEA